MVYATHCHTLSMLGQAGSWCRSSNATHNHRHQNSNERDRAFAYSSHHRICAARQPGPKNAASAPGYNAAHSGAAPTAENAALFRESCLSKQCSFPLGVIRTLSLTTGFLAGQSSLMSDHGAHTVLIWCFASRHRQPNSCLFFIISFLILTMRPSSVWCYCFSGCEAAIGALQMTSLYSSSRGASNTSKCRRRHLHQPA